MKRFYKKYSKHFYRILLFIAAAGLVLYLIPRKGIFRYEYSHGKPWHHETLIAPYDFPVYKSQTELKAEKELILQNFKPYFIVDESIKQEIISDFQSDINNNRSALAKKFPFIEDILSGTHTTLIKGIESKTTELLLQIYRFGLIAMPEEIPDIHTFSVIMAVKNNFAEPYETESIYTYQSAYRFVSQELNAFISKSVQNKKDVIDDLINEMGLNKYLKADFEYDEERTEYEKQKILKNMSLTSGVVISGQRIIDTGEIINEETAKILDSLKNAHEANLGKGRSSTFILLGQGLLVAILFLSLYLFLYFIRNQVYNNFSAVLFLLLIAIFMVIMARLSQTPSAISLYIIPFAILPILVRVFLDSRLSFFFHVVIILLCALFSSNSFEFVILQIPIGIIAMISLYRLVRRAQLVKSAFLIILTYSLIYTGLSLWQEGDITRIDYRMYGLFAINGCFMLLVYPLIYIFEKVFGFLSDVTLVELSDTNHPLLRKLAEMAPGTFQHSIQVGNLAQEAVYKTGGNPLLVRTGAMYHDIGKIESPVYFIENQAGNINPHNGLPFEQSAQIIIHHVENGIKLANKENLPSQIIDFIRTHHGTMKSKYFYNSYINAHPDEPVDVSLFTYSGPAPFSKETAILMMADSVEAASRSLKNYSDDEIDKLVEGIINSQAAENQFINTPLTFRDITEIKEIFKSKLKNIYHARIEYPSLEKKKQ